MLNEAEGGRLPLTLRGASEPAPIEYRTPVPSAQLKSAILLAALNSPGRSTVIESEASRDHTERMLGFFGASVSSSPEGSRGRKIVLEGRPDLRPRPVVVPADPSSAAFALVAALIVPGSDVVVEGVMMNPLRMGLYDTLIEMGADIEALDRRVEGGEEVADLRARHGALRGVEPPAARAPSMIDAYPVLAVAAAFARGETRLRGLAELRAGESGRLQAIAAGLRTCGVDCAVEDDDLVVSGKGAVPGGGLVETSLDHRVAMSFLVMGLAADNPVAIDDDSTIATSFPAFRRSMASLGASIG